MKSRRECRERSGNVDSYRKAVRSHDASEANKIITNTRMTKLTSFVFDSKRYYLMKIVKHKFALIISLGIFTYLTSSSVYENRIKQMVRE